MKRLTPFVLFALAGPALASAPAMSDAQRYVRFRAADAAGDLGGASVEMQALLAGEGGSVTLAQRAYRQGMVAGDHALALNAAHILDKQGQLPPDGPLLFAVDAIRDKDWVAARASVDRLNSGKLFAFLAPLLRAWITLGEGSGDPLLALEDARSSGLSAAYYSSTRALILLASGQTDAAIALIKSQPQFGARIRILAAAELARAKRQPEAIALLAGNDGPSGEARAMLARDGRIDVRMNGAAAGVSELLTQVAVDLSRQRLAPVAILIARMATFADPGNSTAWIATANLLALTKRPAAAALALDHVASGDPFAQSAESLRLSLLLDGGDKDAALAVVARDVRSAGDDAAVWERAGDTYLALDHSDDAAKAYQKAVALTDPAAKDSLWPRYLQLGTALENTDDWAGAKAALEKAVALAPDQPVALNHLGYSLLSRREDLPRAVQLIDQASRLRPDDTAITDSLGWARFVNGDTAGALPLLEHAAAADPGEPTINEHLGDIYWATGRRIEARYAWRAALVGADDKDKSRLDTKIADGWTQATASP
ncbi:tetratricopeptide (TPR) repeat protein [Sphingomonas vulcanisoli]|uniref:Tetratricopeptide (TPR) repeat protein n=1 Tax=Sphingomonas vulcanisoli TaxID=1658060 RepID=A0ABX0TLT3_9SPHN|nr:tetratricopeptide repeat protein [Sphingomonas vulcanisoli]NIJ06474.1 tetratricopeptide (TPR) repeat protein [Sphingomonas vulcanisoli]